MPPAGGAAEPPGFAGPVPDGLALTLAAGRVKPIAPWFW
jgi:hypothetical protein